MKKTIKAVLIIIAYKIFKIKLKINKLTGEAILSKIPNKGKNCLFEGEGIIIDADKLNLGNEIFIGRNFFIKATGKIFIGDYTHISRNVVIHTVNHNSKGNLLPYDKNDIKKEVHIGKYVWIGMNVNILPGVSIGDGAIIGMGTTISKNVNPGEIVVSSPQRVVGERDKNHTDNLLNDEKFLRI